MVREQKEAVRKLNKYFSEIRSQTSVLNPNAKSLSTSRNNLLGNFYTSQQDPKYVDIEVINKNCNIHRGTTPRRGSVGSNYSGTSIGDYSSLPRLSKQQSILKQRANSIGSNDGEQYDSFYNSKRRQSEGYLYDQKTFSSSAHQQQQQSTDKLRKRNSWNSLKNIEHPSSFPSLLRKSDQPLPPRQKESLASQVASEVIAAAAAAQKERESIYGSNNNLRYKSVSPIPQSRGYYSSSTLNGSNGKLKSRPSFGSTTSSIYSPRRDSGSSVKSANGSKRNSVDSNYSRKSSVQRESVPRDYVAFNRRGSTKDSGGDFSDSGESGVKIIAPFIRTISPDYNGKGNTTTRTVITHSILRKSLSPNIDESDSSTSGESKLTKENLTRHVRILEDEETVKRHELMDNDDMFKEYHQKLNAGDRRISTDSLDIRKSSIDVTEATENLKNISLNNVHTKQCDVDRPQFVAVTTLVECQAIRCAEFHPYGKIFAIGSNSKTLRLCEYPSLTDIREDHTTYQPTILYEKPKYHKGSIYCMDWSPDGELLATGSNDKTIKLMRYNDIKRTLEGRDTELTMHDGTIRDLCFIEDATNKASLLISGGAGDNKIYVTDCGTATPFQSLSGHGGHILSLYNWGGAMFVSGSHDKTIRFWDLRTRSCVNTVTPATNPGSRQGSPVSSVSVDPSGRLLVSGHEDSSCVLYDIRGNRPIQCFKPHTADIRSIRFSPSAYYLLTAGYDKKIILTDLQGDLTLPLPSVVVAQHADKVISGRWHPTDFSFLSTSADKTAVLWALSTKP